MDEVTIVRVTDGRTIRTAHTWHRVVNGYCALFTPTDSNTPNTESVDPDVKFKSPKLIPQGPVKFFLNFYFSLASFCRFLYLIVFSKIYMPPIINNSVNFKFDKS